MVAHKAMAHITEVEEMGGMAAAIEAGIPELRIAAAAARPRREPVERAAAPPGGADRGGTLGQLKTKLL